MAVAALSATILGRQSISNAVDYGGESVVGIIMPDAWTSAHVTVQISVDGLKFYDLYSVYEETGTSPEEFKFNVVPGAILSVDPDRLLMGRYLKLRSGTRDQPVLQPTARVFTILVNSKVAAQILPAPEAGP